MRKAESVVGQRFGNLVAIERVGSDGNRHSLWRFRCDCGKECVKYLFRVKKGHTRSCGCMHHQFDDIKGERFGRLTAIERLEKDHAGKTLWRFRCDCGNECTARIGDVRSGNTRSCGCLHDKQNRLAVENRRLYNVWNAMKKRCYSKNSNSYKNYGAKGVRICDSWLSFSNFYEWAIASGYDREAPRGKCTIDRIDPFGIYEPSNCRWVDMKTQSKNKRKDAADELRGMGVCDD